VPSGSLLWAKRDRPALDFETGERTSLRTLYEQRRVVTIVRERCGELRRWGAPVIWDRLGDGWVPTWVGALSSLQCDQLAYPAIRLCMRDAEWLAALQSLLMLMKSAQSDGDPNYRKKQLRAWLDAAVTPEPPQFKARLIKGGVNTRTWRETDSVGDDALTSIVRYG
jgi:hypothetical protein